MRAGLSSPHEAAVFDVVDDEAGAVEHLDQPSYFEDFIFGLAIEQIGNE